MILLGGLVVFNVDTTQIWFPSAIFTDCFFRSVSSHPHSLLTVFYEKFGDFMPHSILYERIQFRNNFQ